MGKPVNPAMADCAMCGKEFGAYPHQLKNGRECCSQACGSKLAGIRKRVDKIPVSCGFCKKDFVVFPYRTKSGAPLYCSKKCGYAGTTASVTISVACPQCGKEFQKRRSAPKIHCSKKCAWAASRTRLTKNCLACGKQFETLICHVKNNTGKYCSRECGYTGIRGEKNWRWRGGVTTTHKKIRDSDNYKEWRKAVFARDRWRCVFCGSKQNICADHILPFAYYPLHRFDVGNGRTLCNPCHKTTDTYGTGARAYAE